MLGTKQCTRDCMKMKVKIKKIDSSATIPEKAHDSDFGYDCYAVSEQEIAPNVWKYGLGFAIQLDTEHADYTNFGFTIRPRSSIYKTGMVLANSIGTIDEDYTGEVCAIFYHVLPNMPRYKVGDKICQLHIDTAYKLDFVEVNELTSTRRGSGGFGSSDKKNK